MLEVRTYNISDSNILSVQDRNGESAVFNNYEVCNYITFDGLGVNLLDSSKKFYTENDYLGLRSGLSDENGTIMSFDVLYDINNEIITDINNEEIFVFGANIYDSGGVLISLNSETDTEITIVFANDNCTQLRIQNAENTAEGDALYYLDVDNNIITFTLSGDYKSWIIEPYKTRNPFEIVTIESIIGGTISTFTKFKSYNLIEEINVLSDDLPINQFQMTVLNRDNLPLEKRKPITVISNGKYYGTFYIKSVKRVEEFFYEVTAQNAVGILDNTSFDVWHETFDFNGAESGFVDEMKKASGVTLTPHETVNLDNLSVYGHIPVNTCRYALCAACFSLGLMVDGSRNQDIILRTIPTVISSQILTKDRRILGNALLDKTEVVTSAKMHRNVSFETEETVTLDYAKGGKYYFKDAPLFSVAQASGTTVSNLATNLNFIEFSSSSKSSFSATKKKPTSDVYSILNPDATDEASNEVDFTNFDLSGNSSASGVLTEISRDNDVLKFIRSKGKVTAKVRLRNERVGDLIQIETAWDGIVTGIITKMDIQFGYEDIADIEVLEWSL